MSQWGYFASAWWSWDLATIFQDSMNIHHFETILVNKSPELAHLYQPLLKKKKKYHPSIMIIHVNPCSSMTTHEKPTIFHYNSPYQSMFLIHMLIHQSIDWVPRRCVSLHELFDVCLPNAPWPVEFLPWKASTVHCKYPNAMHTI